MPFSGFDTEGYKNPFSEVDIGDKVVRVEAQVTTITLADQEVYVLGDPAKPGTYYVQFDQFLGIFGHDGESTILLNFGDAAHFDIAVGVDANIVLRVNGTALELVNDLGGGVAKEIRIWRL